MGENSFAPVPDNRSWLTKHVDQPALGGSAAGTHFYKEWISCRRKWYWKFRAPHPQGEGLRPKFVAPALMIGSATHDGIEAYYHDYAATGGNPSLQEALDASAHTLQASKDKFVSLDAYNDAITEVSILLTDYHAYWGPGGTHPEAADMTIFEDAEGPVIEREFRIPLGEGRPPFTCRVDAMVNYKGGLYVLEHKTTTVYGVRGILMSLETQAQGTSECMVLRKLYPDHPVDGLLANLLVKKRSPRSTVDPFIRDIIRRTGAQCDRHLQQLKVYADSLRGHNSVMDNKVGGPAPDPMDLFPADGMFNGHCQSYNRNCEFMELCQNAGDETALVAGYGPNRRIEDPTEQVTNESEEPLF